MLDFGWTELLLIGVVALIVIGPKDLPAMFHTLGRITARARGMAREFSSAMEDAAKASGVSDVTKDLRDLQKLTSPRSMGLDALGRAADKFEKWDPLQPMRDAGAAPTPDPDAAPPVAPATAGTAAAPEGQSATASSVPVATPAAGSLIPAQQAALPESAHQPGQRRLHAVRRSDRS